MGQRAIANKPHHIVVATIRRNKASPNRLTRSSMAFRGIFVADGARWVCERDDTVEIVADMMDVLSGFVSVL